MTGQKHIGKKFLSEHGGGGSYRCCSVLLCVRARTVHAEFKRVSTLFNAHHKLGLFTISLFHIDMCVAAVQNFVQRDGDRIP